jgi:hypothetical protein
LIVLETAFGSGVKDPLMDVGEVWTIDGAAGVASGVAATATPGTRRITPIANTKVVEIRRTRPRTQHLTVASPSRMCPRVPIRYVHIGLHVEFIDCKKAFAARR